MPGASGASSLRRGDHELAPSTRSMSARGKAAGAQQRRLAEAGNDRRLDADRAGPGVDHHVDAAAQIGEHMRRRGRRNMAGPVGRRRHHRPAEGRQQRVRGRGAPARARRWCRARRAPDRRRRSPAASAAPASAVPARTRRRAFRPSASKRARRRAASTSATCAISGLKARPAFGGVKPGHGLAIAGIGAEPIDGLGGKGDQPALAQAARRRS